MTSRYTQILFKNRKPDRIATLAEYRASGGYTALADVLAQGKPEAVQQTLLDASLLGRGGAAFPTARKMMSVAADAPYPRYLVCNADEMEPGTFKDRVLIHADPHLLIEGMAIAAYSFGAGHGIIFIRPEYENAARILTREIGIAAAAGLLGNDILGSGFDFEIVVHRSGGRYICGEVTAQNKALMGLRPNPQQAPPFPTQKGLWDLPTVNQNVETLACIPHIARNGADWFKGLARTPGAAGTKLYCVSGRVANPGCFELPMGMPLKEIIEEVAGGMAPGSEFKTCLPGGASTGFLTPEFYEVAMDYDSLKAAGNRLGTGAIMVFDQKTCLVAATLNLIEFFSRESCGWCTPCREGLPYLRDLLWRIETGRGEEEHIDILETMCKQLWQSYCAFAPGAVAALESLMKYFKDEILDHIQQKKCPLKR